MGKEINGYKFEHWVKELLKNTGKYKVKHNITLKDKKKKVTAQFDITYGLFSTYYVECKYRSKGSLVKFSELATFAGKLKLFNISYRKGIFVTNSYYEKRAIVYAKDLNIKLFDKDDLYKMYDKNKFFNFGFSFGKKDSLDMLIKKYKI